MNEDELITKISAMSPKEYRSFMLTVALFDKIIQLVGVMLLLLILVYPSIPAIIATALLVYVLAGVSANINHMNKKIRKVIDNDK